MATILVIEDDPDSRELLCELLRGQGFTTVEAVDGQEGLVRLDEHARLCIILLDLMMPNMDGWEFRRRQSRHPVHARVPVIVLTADTRMNGRAADLQADALLTKPIDLPQLLSVVCAHCQP
jgi:CheY-like chemotaxis protein